MPAGPPGCALLSVLIVAAAPQVAFVGHDAGHNAVTHDRFKDGLIGLLVSWDGFMSLSGEGAPPSQLFAVGHPVWTPLPLTGTV